MIEWFFVRDHKAKAMAEEGRVRQLPQPERYKDLEIQLTRITLNFANKFLFWLFERLSHCLLWIEITENHVLIDV